MTYGLQARATARIGVMGGRSEPAPLLLATVDLSSVPAGGSFAIPATIQAGKRYILELSGLIYSDVTDGDGALYGDQNTWIQSSGLQFQSQPEGGKPARMVFYVFAGGGYTIATDLFTVPVGEAFDLAAEWGMNTQYMAFNGVPIYAQEGTGNMAVKSHTDDPSGLGYFRLPAAGTAQSLRVYERTNMRQIVLLGDSMTANPDFDSALRLASNRNRNFINSGAGGRKLEDILAALSSDVQPFYQSSAVSNSVVLRAGVNNLSANGQAADMLATVQDIGDAVKVFNGGWNVDLCTITPFDNFYSNGATQTSAEAQRQAYNAGLSNIAGIRRVLGTGGITELQNPNDATYYIDKLHCTAAGYQLIADYIAAKL